MNLNMNTEELKNKTFNEYVINRIKDSKFYAYKNGKLSEIESGSGGTSGGIITVNTLEFDAQKSEIVNLIIDPSIKDYLIKIVPKNLKEGVTRLRIESKRPYAFYFDEENYCGSWSPVYETAQNNSALFINLTKMGNIFLHESGSFFSKKEFLKIDINLTWLNTKNFSYTYTMNKMVPTNVNASFTISDNPPNNSYELHFSFPANQLSGSGTVESYGEFSSNNIYIWNWTAYSDTDISPLTIILNGKIN